MSHLIEKDFSNIARNRDDFIIRDAQTEIAKEIYDFITPENKPYSSLIAEAGTGIGKSLAYLVPITRAGTTAIVSTNTKALQKQLTGELKSLQKLYSGITFKVLQGASNYACILKAKGIAIPTLHNWLNRQFRTNGDGMIDDFKTSGKQFKKTLWGEISTDPNMCQESCPHFSECFYQSAKKEAMTTTIVIVNHDLLLLNYKVQSELYKNADVIVIDEAHHFIEKTRKNLSRSLSQTTLSRYVKGLNWKLNHIHKSRIQFNAEEYERLEEEIFDFFPTEQQTTRLQSIHEELQTLVLQIVRRIENDSDSLPADSKDQKIFQEFAVNIRKIFLENDSNCVKVYSVRNSDNQIDRKIETIPIDIAPLLATFFNEKRVVMTSATLRDGNSFDFFKTQIGQPQARTIYQPSPFDRGNVSLFVPSNPIDPAQPGYHQNLTNQIISIHQKMHGRSLFLFTNKEDLDGCHSLIPKEIKEQFYIQTHTAEIPDMVNTLKEKDNVSLMGLSALWEGIDIVGQALSCVCIMRMPFANPDDIVFSAIKEKFRTENPNIPEYRFFETYDLPQMLLKLKQGFGRLIRRETDTGLIALLDNRFMRKKYRNRIIELLKEYQTFDNLAEAIENIPHINTRFSKISDLAQVK